MGPLIIILVLGALILAFGLYVLLYRKQRLSQKDKQKIQLLWQEILSLEHSHPEQAILKADKLLDFALQKAGYTGTLGEKLKAARAVFRDNDAVWSAHKLRNQIAHDIDAKLSAGRSGFALKAFKAAFYDLGIKL